ncbi:MAG: hypothetical protein IJ091_03725 [Oscillospiraceae bacterium]|nr:hypothetical protein [Oscillospiraceae bacterium]
MISEYTYATGRLGNKAFFGTVKELAEYAYQEEVIFSRYLESIPADLYWVYRSLDCFGTNSYGRRNTCFWVFWGEPLSTKEDALALFEKTGLRTLIDALRGSVVILSPVKEEWTQEDADNLTRLQRIALDCMLDYFGSFGTNYFIGIDSGADFIHDYVTSSPEISCTVAGAIAIGGATHPEKANLASADFILQSHAFPAYLFDSNDDIVNRYLHLQGMENSVKEETEEISVYTSKVQPLLQVMVDRSKEGDAASRIRNGYEKLLCKRMCIPVGPGRNSLMDSTYWALGRKYSSDELGLVEKHHENGEILSGTQIRRWYIWIPKEAFLKTEKKIPLILLLHGHCDDPRSLAEQCGFLELAGKERIVVCAPEHQYITDLSLDDLNKDSNKAHQLGRFVDHMFSECPMLDPERVYVTGFSRGGLNTCMLSFFETQRFAAAAPLSGLGLFGVGESSGETVSVDNWVSVMKKEGKELELGLPAYILVCGRDSVFSDRYGLRAHLKLESLGGRYGGGAADALNIYRILNGLSQISAEDYDFSRYPFWGFPMEESPATQTPDLLIRNGQICGKGGHPVLHFAVPEGLDHSLYFAYAEEMWNFCKHCRRDQESKEIVWKD